MYGEEKKRHQIAVAAAATAAFGSTCSYVSDSGQKKREHIWANPYTLSWHDCKSIFMYPHEGQSHTHTDDRTAKTVKPPTKTTATDGLRCFCVTRRTYTHTHTRTHTLTQFENTEKSIQLAFRLLCHAVVCSLLHTAYTMLNPQSTHHYFRAAYTPKYTLNNCTHLHDERTYTHTHRRLSATQPSARASVNGI